MNDLVSRQAVKDWLEKWRGYLDDDMIARMQIGTKDIEPAQQWKRITCRPMDEEERKYWSELRGYTLEDDEAVIYTGAPDDGERSIKGGSRSTERKCRKPIFSRKRLGGGGAERRGENIPEQ